MGIPRKSKPELGLFWCSRHKALLDKSEFYTNKRASFGVASICKQCNKEWNAEYRKVKPEISRRASERFRKTEKGAAYIAAWEASNKEKRDQWREEYFPRKLALNKERAMRKNKATPPWADLIEIRRIYVQAKTLTRETGVQHDVDHIVPLKGRTVCGLHVVANLRIITADENRRKSNRFHQE